MQAWHCLCSEFPWLPTLHTISDSWLLNAYGPFVGAMHGTRGCTWDALGIWQSALGFPRPAGTRTCPGWWTGRDPVCLALPPPSPHPALQRPRAALQAAPQPAALVAAAPVPATRAPALAAAEAVACRRCARLCTPPPHVCTSPWTPHVARPTTLPPATPTSPLRWRTLTTPSAPWCAAAAAGGPLSFLTDQLFVSFRAGPAAAAVRPIPWSNQLFVLSRGALAASAGRIY